MPQVSLTPLLLLLLCFQLIQFHLLAIDLILLRLDLLLQRRVLFLPGLHLIADQRAAEESDRSADSGAGSCIAGCAADDRAQSSSGKGSDRGAFFTRGERLGTADKKQGHQYD